MLSKQYQHFAEQLRANPGDNPTRVGYAKLRSIQEQRILTENCGCQSITQKAAEYGGIHAEWLIPERAEEGKAVVYIHGGGWSLGSIRQTRLFLAPMVECFGVSTVHFDYRLMPENPFPAGLDDCVSLWRGLLETGWDAGSLVLAGESAGANLALALLLRLRQENLQMPAAACLMSPITFQDTMEGSHTELAPLDFILAEDSFLLDRVSELYAPGMDKRSVLLSPLYADLHGMPPMQLFVGTDEKLFDDTVRFYQKLRLSGVEAELHVGDHMCHSWPIFMNSFPEAREAVQEMSAYIRQQLRSGKGNAPYYEQQLVQTALDEIEQHYRQANLSALADRNNQTLYGYSKLIKQYTGRTFKQLLKDRRFAVAKQLLLETDKPVKTIAAEVGYENLTHFYELFRKEFGETPQKLREKLAGV